MFGQVRGVSGEGCVRKEKWAGGMDRCAKVWGGLIVYVCVGECV